MPMTSCLSVVLTRCATAPGAATVVRFPPADDAGVGGDLDDHGVALDRATDAQRHAVLRIDRKRGRIRLDVDDAQAAGAAMARGRCIHLLAIYSRGLPHWLQHAGA